MFPWLWLWTPQFHFPWSGNVVQNIEPETDWFFGSIQPDAGNAQIEKKIFDVASYGKQIGLISDLLLELTKSDQQLSPESIVLVEKLKELHAKIESIKANHYSNEVDELVSRVESIQKRGGASSDLLKVRLREILM